MRGTPRWILWRAKIYGMRSRSSLTSATSGSAAVRRNLAARKYSFGTAIYSGFRRSSLDRRWDDQANGRTDRLAQFSGPRARDPSRLADEPGSQPDVV